MSTDLKKVLCSSCATNCGVDPYGTWREHFLKKKNNDFSNTFCVPANQLQNKKSITDLQNANFSIDGNSSLSICNQLAC